jgi:hypothetical protein
VQGVETAGQVLPIHRFAKSSEQPVPQSEELPEVGVVPLGERRVVYVVQGGCNEHPTQSSVNGAGDLHVGVLEQGRRRHQNCARRNQPEWESEYAQESDSPTQVDGDFGGVKPQAGRHVDAIVRVMDGV